MAETGDLLVVNFIGPMQVGAQFERTRHEWPLHITMAPWFYLEDTETLSAALNGVADSADAFEVEVGGEELFGLERDVAVNVVIPQSAEMLLHRAIVSAIRDAGGVFRDERWIGQSHRPHITHHDDNRRYEGDVELFDNFHLVRLLPGNLCEVAEEFVLQPSGGVQ